MGNNALRDRETSARAILKRQHELDNEDSVADMPKGALNARYRQLGSDFKDFKKAHKAVVREIPADELEAAAVYFEQINQSYFASANTLKAALEGKSSAPSNKANIIRVETARAPDPGIFDGNPSNWPSFRDQFLAEVHDRPQIDDVTKLHFLRKACTGAAKLTFGTWQPLAINYKKAWECLAQKYEDPYRLEQALVSDLLRIPALMEESHDGLRKIIDTSTNTLRQLEAMQVPVQHWDSFVIGLILCRLPRNVADLWEQKRVVATMPKLADLMTFLEGRARGRIYLEQGTPSTSSPPNIKAHSYNRQSNTFSASFKLPCTFCSGLHALHRCPSFLLKSKSERLAKLKEFKLCVRCLKKHEGVCLSTCFRCDGAHNSVVCQNTPNKEMRTINTIHMPTTSAKRQRLRKD